MKQFWSFLNKSCQTTFTVVGDGSQKGFLYVEDVDAFYRSLQKLLEGMESWSGDPKSINHLTDLLGEKRIHSKRVREPDCTEETFQDKKDLGWKP